MPNTHNNDMKYSGGFINSLQSFMNNMDSPIKLLYGFVIILVIVYSSIVPFEYKQFLDSILGRVFGITIVYGIIHTMGWIYGLLTVLALLTIMNGVHIQTNMFEGFDGGGSVSEKKIIGKRWFVEKMLGETPKKIAVDKVTTSAIDD